MTRATSNERGYGSKWQSYRKGFIKRNPLCVFCKAIGKITAATVVDHITPHKGNKKLFWDEKNHQALCTNCHDSHKQRIERLGYSNMVDDAGWPIDENHPVNCRSRLAEDGGVVKK
jgi:5-methylcytosine-specific restriction endonuclease McrA